MSKREIDINDPKDVARVLSDFVNNYNADTKGLAKALASDHRTLQQSKMRLFLEFVAEMDALGKAGFSDLRNEASCLLATAIMEIPEEKRSLPYV